MYALSFSYFPFVFFAANFVDVMDKSPFGLLNVGFEMFKAHQLTPAAAQKLFTTFLSLKTHHAALGKTFPSVSDIKQQLQFSLPLQRGAAPSPPAPVKTKGSTSKKQKTAAAGQPTFCYDWNSGNCQRSQGVSCQLHGKTLVHGCNKKIAGRFCGENHTRADCPK